MGVTLHYSWKPVTLVKDLSLDNQGRAHGSIIVRDDGSTTPDDTPVVLLLHGLSGDIFHFTEPGQSPSMAGLLDYDRSRTWPGMMDHGWRVYPNMWPVWKIDDDDVLDTEGYTTFLTRAGFRAATYQQVEVSGLLANPVVEAHAVLQAIAYAFPEAPLHLVAHSRGGLLARKLLLQVHKSNTPSLDRVRTLTTIGTPHDGSAWGSAMVVFGRTAEKLPTPLADNMSTPAQILRAIKEIAKVVVTPAYSEIQRVDLTGNGFLDDLRDREAVAAKDGLYDNVVVRTIGGTSTKATRVHIYWMNPICRIPIFGFFYRWISHHQEISLFDVLKLTDDLEQLVPEITDGLGDLLVGERYSRFAYARSHEKFPVNHAEELWDIPIKDLVLEYLGGPLHRKWDGAVAITPGAMPTMAPGRRRTVDVRVTNTGTEDWLSGDITLESVDPRPWGLPMTISVPPLVSGASWTTSMKITSPRTLASYKLGWRLQSRAQGQIGPERVMTVKIDDTCASLREELKALDKAIHEAGANGEQEDLRFLAQERARTAVKFRRHGCS